MSGDNRRDDTSGDLENSCEQVGVAVNLVDVDPSLVISFVDLAGREGNVHGDCRHNVAFLGCMLLMDGGKDIYQIEALDTLTKHKQVIHTHNIDDDDDRGR